MRKLRDQDDLMRKLDDKDEKIRLLAKELGEEKTRNSLESALWSAPASETRLYVAGREYFLHTQEAVEMTLRDAGRVRALTGCTADNFDYLYQNVLAYVSASHHSPLFDDIVRRAADPGNRCKLSVKQALLMVLVHERQGGWQELIATTFGIDQTTVSRYVAVMREAIDASGPTARRILERLRSAPPKVRATLVPGNAIIIDGTHTPIRRPGDAERRNGTYSGKKKAHTYNTTVVSNLDGAVVALGPTKPGSVHDLTAATGEPLLPGHIDRSMRDPRTPKSKRVKVYVDKGYAGLAKHFPGADIMQPHKKYKNRALSAADRAHNRRVGAVRVGVEHTIGLIKNFGRTTAPFEGAEEEFHAHMNTITCLVNMQILNRMGRTKKKKFLKAIGLPPP